MPLTKEQLSEIRKFIHSRGFTTIEVEMEILDHVASAVEAKLEAQPNKSITKAIQEVHAGFGPLGFSVMEDEFRKSYLNEYRLLRNGIIKDLFGSSKVISVLMTFITSYILGLLILPLPMAMLQIIFYSTTLILGLALFLYFRSMFRQWRKKSMIIGAQQIKIVVFFYLFIYCFEFFGDSIFPALQTSCLFFSLVMTVIIVYSFCTKEMIKAAFNWANERYLKYASH